MAYQDRQHRAYVQASKGQQGSRQVNPLSGAGDIRTVPVPGRRCPACLKNGQTVWVIPNKQCPKCGTVVT